MQTIAIKDASMADLLSFFNTHTVRLLDGKPVKRFADRATAEKRCLKLGDMLEVEFSKTQPGTYPPEGMIIVGDLVDEDTGEKIEVEAIDSKPVSTLNGHGVADEESEEEDDTPDVNSFASMGGALGALGDKKEPRPSSAGRASNSLGVALSWLVPNVRVRRLTRDSVTVEVDGESYSFKSAQDAFREFHLPESKFIRFRIKLKEERSRAYEHDGKSYLFTIVEGGADE